MAQKPHFRPVLGLRSLSELYCRGVGLHSCLLAGPETCAVASLSPRWTSDPQRSLCAALSPSAPNQTPWMAPVPNSSLHHVWGDWWTLSPALSSVCHAQVGWACVLAGEGTAGAGLTWGSSLFGAASRLCTLTCPAGLWSATPATESRSWHPGTKLSCFCCSWHTYYESIMYFTFEKSCNSVLQESNIPVRKGEAINGVFGGKIFCLVSPRFLWNVLCLSELLVFSL